MRYLSLFSGIEAATAAWHELGWTPVAFADIEAFPNAVTAHHYPSVPNLGDVTKIGEEQIALLGPIDLVVFGSPCQDLSVAGKRAGLQGERSGLFHDAIRIIRWARAYGGARFALWENVPGAFSSNKGADFAVVVGELAGCTVDVPPRGWGNEGALAGPEALVEWSTLDAQWFGVAQRRRRVFAFADFGNWSRRPPVLLEPEGLRGDSAPRREAGEGVAGTLESRTRGGGFPGTDGAAAGHTVACGPHGGAAGVARPLLAKPNSSHDESEETYVVAHQDVARCLNAGAMERIDWETETFVTEPIVFDTTQITHPDNGSRCEPGAPCHTLPKGGHAPVIAFHHNAQAAQLPTEGRNTGVSDSLTCSQNAAVAFSCKDHGADAGEVAPTLRSMGFDGSHANGGGQVAIATSMQVRRLTPRECERLQGFPDEYTLITVRGKPAADGPRYKALGNSMAVPVMRWIGEAIDCALWCERYL